MRIARMALVGTLVAISGSIIGYGYQEQEQGQGQEQGQDQLQVQVQAQSQGQSVETSSEQGNTQSITEVHPKEKSLVRGSQALFVPQGNEGIGLQTPWGGPMITQGSQMAKLQALHGLAIGANDSATAALALQWAIDEAKPKKLLGINRTEKACRNWLIGLFCF